MLAYMRLEANNYRWRFNLVTGEVREGDIDDLNTEFNKTNPLYGGQKSRYAYHQYIPTHEEGGYTLRFTGLVKYDTKQARAGAMTTAQAYSVARPSMPPKWAQPQEVKKTTGTL